MIPILDSAKGARCNQFGSQPSWTEFRDSQGVEGICFGGLMITSLILTDDLVLLTLSDRDLQLSLEKLTAESESAGKRIINSKFESIVVNRKRFEWFLWIGDKVNA